MWDSAVSLNPLWCLCFAAKDSAVVMTEDTKEQLLEASSATKKAFNSYRREADPEDHYTSADGQPSTGDKNQDDGEMSFVIVIMQPILRFLQLLCENHNRDLQVGQTEHHTLLVIHLCIRRGHTLLHYLFCVFCRDILCSTCLIWLIWDTVSWFYYKCQLPSQSSFVFKLRFYFSSFIYS